MRHFSTIDLINRLSSFELEATNYCIEYFNLWKKIDNSVPPFKISCWIILILSSRWWQFKLRTKTKKSYSKTEKFFFVLIIVFTHCGWCLLRIMDVFFSYFPCKKGSDSINTNVLNFFFSILLWIHKFQLPCIIIISVKFFSVSSNETNM